MRAGFRNSSAVDQRLVVVAGEPQKIGAPTLAPAQVARVVDEPGEVCVLEVDADGQNMTASPCRVRNDAAGKVGPVPGVVRLRH
jgi:hypothetical protein